MEEFKTTVNDVENIKQRQKEIACQCLKNFGLLGNVQKEFADTGKLYYSERTTRVFDGILYWMPNHPEWENGSRTWRRNTGFWYTMRISIMRLTVMFWIACMFHPIRTVLKIRLKTARVNYPPLSLTA